MRLKVLSVFIFFIASLASGQETSQLHIQDLDSLLIAKNFQELDLFLKSGKLDSVQVRKYEVLLKELHFLQEYSREDIYQISKSGLQYIEVFTPFHAGHIAAVYYSEFIELHNYGDYYAAVARLKIAKHHKAIFLDELYIAVLRILEGAETSFSSGNYSDAYDLLKPIEEQVYAIEKLRSIREVYSIRLNRCNTAKSSRLRATMLADTHFTPDNQYEISAYGGMLVFSQEFSNLKPRVLKHSTMTSYESTTYLSNFKASGGFSYGIEIGRRLIQKFHLLLRLGSGLTFYSGMNDSTQKLTSIVATHELLGLGIRYNMIDRGRINYYSSIHYSRCLSQNKKEEYAHLKDIPSHYFYTPVIKEQDDQFEINAGAILYPLGNYPLIVQANMAYVQTLGEPSYFGPKHLRVSFSLGMYF